MAYQPERGTPDRHSGDAWQWRFAQGWFPQVIFNLKVVQKNYTRTGYFEWETSMCGQCGAPKLGK